jgi:hypothetical protein
VEKASNAQYLLCYPPFQNLVRREMDYLLYSNSTSTTGKALIAALKEAGCKIEGGTQGPGKNKVGTLIRWGCSKLVGKPGKILNKAKAIDLASDKLESLKTLKDNDIRVPEVFMPDKVTFESFPLLGRKKHHIAGNDIVFCLQKTDIPEARAAGCTYFTKYIPKAREYRVHVFDGQAIKISQKLLTEPNRNKDPWIWNFDEGYTFHVQKEKLPSMGKMMAMASVEALGLNFGAVDIIIGDDGKSYILEVNTAPGLQTDSSIDVYVEKFKAILASN